MMPAMMMRLLLITILTFCTSAPRAFAMNGPDPDNLMVATFDISGRKLLLPLPSSRSTKDLDEVRQPVVTRIDMATLHSTPKKLLDDMWDWRSPLHLYGSIGIKLYVESVAFGPDLTCRGSLKEMLQAKFEMNSRSSESNPKVLPVFRDLTEAAMRERVVSYRWTAFSQDKKGENDEESFVIALSSHEYVTLRMNYYGGGDPMIKPSDWLPRAEAIKQAIIQGMRLEGDWPVMRDCQ
jgi:hypothetical protein